MTEEMVKPKAMRMPLSTSLATSHYVLIMCFFSCEILIPFLISLLLMSLLLYFQRFRIFLYNKAESFISRSIVLCLNLLHFLSFTIDYFLGNTQKHTPHDYYG